MKKMKFGLSIKESDIEYAQSLEKELKEEEKLIAEKRYNICVSCDRFMKITKQCKECFCFIPLKTKIMDTECPIGKWNSINE